MSASEGRSEEAEEGPRAAASRGASEAPSPVAPAPPVAVAPALRRSAETALLALAAAGRTLATAESCTGGLVGAALTSVPGSSRAYRGGVVAYADEAKARLLGVPASLVAAEGAVSEAVARAMAVGARAALGADVAVAVTGVAGPGGGSAAKPVGTVWLSVAAPEGVTARRLALAGDRDAVRAATVLEALTMVARDAAAAGDDVPGPAMGADEG